MAKKIKVSKTVNGQEQELRGQLMRALADYDNLKKRVEKEKKDWEEESLIKFAAQIMPILDMLVNINAHTKDSGLAIAIKEFEKALNSLGIEKIPADPGKMFDAALHEAIEGEDTENGKKGEILEELLTGWKTSSGRVIRHARVKVRK
ncbi:MAG: Protein GrpE [Candidatus Woesebacteria bacterium GW2011_GWB1_43_14]|uniref:Protein GrpE n=1 Tax=Candidatus Woesebacteria bacterium GW2011_GWB1_43_14 TaxID=1618578 RepID=A0A0G1FQW7_9BACT|nr:MAG: Protein GrpE [Candidatus Woesebacteria bacterium GW2011_GWA1_39_11b]KKS77990.1 MAG: Protein GrpE [Candidatus Woesebacteria bacterium GW2011_GWC1_42_9]KKS97431.1 MAG: Protein GrpE [Candidatus Woesebacteria bacterium GW2011_GWB1_43_14]